VAAVENVRQNGWLERTSLFAPIVMCCKQRVFGKSNQRMNSSVLRTYFPHRNALPPIRVVDGREHVGVSGVLLRSYITLRTRYYLSLPLPRRGNERVSVPTGKLHPLRSMRYIFFVYNPVQAQWSTPLLLLVLYTPAERRNTRMYRKNGRLYRFRSFQNG